MNPIRCLTYLAFITFGLSHALAEIELIGVFATSTRTAFALSDLPGMPATWHALGDTFAGYRLASFESKADTLVLQKGNQVLRVRIKDPAKIKHARLEFTGMVQISGGQTVSFSRTQLQLGRETALSLPNGITWRVTPRLHGDANLEYQLLVDRMHSDGSTEVLTAPRVIVRPDHPFDIAVGEYRFAFLPTRP